MKYIFILCLLANSTMLKAQSPDADFCSRIESVARISAVIRDTGIMVDVKIRDTNLLLAFMDSAKWVLVNPGENAKKFGDSCRKHGVDNLHVAFRELENERKLVEQNLKERSQFPK